MQSTPAEHKIILGGNHDAVLDSMTPAQVSKHLFTENVSLSTSTAGKTRVNEKGLVEGKLHPRKERVNENEKNTAAKKRQEQEQGREREQADKYRVDGWVYPSKSTDKDILTEASTSTETETETEKSESKSKSKTYYLDNAFVSIRGLQIFGTPCSSGLSRNVGFQTQINREKAWRRVAGIGTTAAPSPKHVEASVHPRKQKCGRAISTVARQAISASRKSRAMSPAVTARRTQSVALRPLQKT